MPKGRKCHACNNYMYAIKEEQQPAGAYVTYECRNKNCKTSIKIFEDK